MILSPLKYYFSILLLFIVADSFSQSISNNATLTIIGDPIPEGPINVSGGRGNPYINTSVPPEDEQELASPQNIEPTFENGFYIRYQIVESPKEEERPIGTGYEYASITSSSTTAVKIGKKHMMNIAQKSFNFKKKIKSWIPKRKKKYRPHLCGRFK